MPKVDIDYKPFLLRGDNQHLAFEALKKAVSNFCSNFFSTKDLQLNRNDFSFTFTEAGEHDELTNDLIVRIQLHAFPERLSRIDDSSATFALVIADEIAMFTDFNLTVGVSLLFAEIGWGTSDTDTATVKRR